MSKKPGSKAPKAKPTAAKPAPKKSVAAPVRPLAAAKKPAAKAAPSKEAAPSKVAAPSKEAAPAKDNAKKLPPVTKPPLAPAKAATVVPAKLAPPARTIATSKPAESKKTEGGTKKMAARAKISDIVLPPGYRPAETEPFMNEMHRAYFRKRLIEWKDDILRQTRETLAILHEDSTQHADLADRATSETDRATELRTRDRQRKLISKIDAAMSRIEDGTYGFCEDTGEPIGLKRLDARPIATLSVEAQERHERREKVYREE